MIKLVCFLLFSFNIMAQEVIYDGPEMSIEERLKMLQEKYNAKADVKKETFWRLYYFSMGKSIDSLAGEKYTSRSTSLGYKKIKEKFIQGFEYNESTAHNVFKTSLLKYTLGYQLNFDSKYTPYIEYQFGFNNIKLLDRNTFTDKTSFGYTNAIEAGFFLNKFGNFLLMAGTNIAFTNFESKEVKSMTSQNFFFRLGFEF